MIPIPHFLMANITIFVQVICKLFSKNHLTSFVEIVINRFV